jgi:choline dehydrogenase-like flavoprotein
MKRGPSVVVIGSGPAGAAACFALSEAGVDTLLLEAGLEQKARGMLLRVRGITVAKARHRLELRPGVTMTGDAATELYEDLSPGGLSNHWSLAVPRFAPEDFADAARAGEEFTWPIGYADLAPWYERVEPLLHIAGATSGCAQVPAGRVKRPTRLAPSWESASVLARNFGRSLMPMPYAYGKSTTLARTGNAFNAFERVIRPLHRAGRLEVRFGARAVRLDWSSESQRVEGVFVRNALTGGEERIPCRAVVLAAGAVTSAQILLESESPDFPEGLGNAHGVVGRYLHDHPLGKLVLDLDAPIGVYPAVYLTRPTLERSPAPLYAAACMQWSGGVPLAKSALRGHPARLEEIGFSVFGTVIPTRDDWVALDRERPRVGGTSALTLHLGRPAEAERVLEQARDELVALLGQAGFPARVRVWKVEPIGNANHYGGTCRMHASPRFGVIDRFSRVHGVRNVAVADSSAFTTGPEKNPVLTAMALGARAAANLAEHVKQGDL